MNNPLDGENPGAWRDPSSNLHMVAQAERSAEQIPSHHTVHRGTVVGVEPERMHLHLHRGEGPRLPTACTEGSGRQRLQEDHRQHETRQPEWHHQAPGGHASRGALGVAVDRLLLLWQDFRHTAAHGGARDPARRDRRLGSIRVRPRDGVVEAVSHRGRGGRPCCLGRFPVSMIRPLQLGGGPGIGPARPGSRGATGPGTLIRGPACVWSPGSERHRTRRPAPAVAAVTKRCAVTGRPLSASPWTVPRFAAARRPPATHCASLGGTVVQATSTSGACRQIS